MQALHRQTLWKALLCFFLFMQYAPLTFAADDAAEYDAKLQQLKQSIDKLQKELEAVKGEHSTLESNLKDSEIEIGEQLEKIKSANKKIKLQNKKLNNLQSKKKDLQKQRRTQKIQIASQIKSAYKSGPQSNIRLLLNQESPESIVRIMKYHDYILSARSNKLERYLSTLNKLNAIEPKIISEKNQLTRNKTQLGLHHKQLAQEQSKRESTLLKLKNLIASKDNQLRLQDQNRTHLQHFFNEMTATVSQVNLPIKNNIPFSRTKGKLPWPVNGSVQHRFGSTRIRGQLKWEGIVINATAGTIVKAIHSGRVIFSDYLRGQGLLLIIDHGEGYLSLYAHNQSLFRQTGDTIRTGDTIAHIGESGGQDYAGLYFEIRHNGRPTNPTPWLRKT